MKRLRFLHRLGQWSTGRLLLAAVLYRYICHSLMLLPVLLNELRPAPTLPDLLLAHVPYVPWLARWNYFLWVACYIPPALYLLHRDKQLFVRLVALDGIVSLLRGVMIPLTGFGPPLGADINAIHPFSLWPTWLALLNPLQALMGNTAGIYLTKDMFYSGHAATTFLLYLYSRKLGRVSRVYLGLHLFTVAVVFLSHLHYTVDVVAAYFVVFTLFTLWESLWGRIDKV